jgi:folate-dependent phosphoribosylglycinamide formyltransferase PurN
MHDAPNIIILTGQGLRHRYVAHQLARGNNVLGIINEAKAPIVAPSTQLCAADQAVIDLHFKERDAVEAKLLGAVPEFPKTEVLNVPNGTSNSPELFEWVKQRQPDFIVLYGSSIIKPPLLDYYENRIVNMHLGLSPYYRGSGTNFWPLVNGEPECVGATIHLAVLKVDAGSILAQVRPLAAATDRVHELGTKTIMAGAKVLALAPSLLADGIAAPKGQDLSRGRVYRNRDFNADAVRTAWKKLDAGMMAEYVTQREARCRSFPIVELENCES